MRATVHGNAAVRNLLPLENLTWRVRREIVVWGNRMRSIRLNNLNSVFHPIYLVIKQIPKKIILSNQSNKTEIHIDTCNSPTETEKYSATNKTERESPLLSSDEAKTDKDNSLTKTENSSSLPLSNNTEKDGSSIDKYISTTTTDSEIPRICLPSCPSSDALINLIDRLKSLLAENQVDHCVNLSHQLVLE